MKPQTLYPTHPLLLVDDETVALRSCAMTLRMQGINHIVECQDSRNVAGLLAEQRFSLLLIDLTMPYCSGEEILTLVAEQYPDLPVIVVTAMDTVETAVLCMKKGAMDYMVKPVEKTRLVSGIRRIIEMLELRAQAVMLKEHLLSDGLRAPEAFAGIITGDKTMLALFQYMEAIAASRYPVLVTGETGVGKELLVKAIHTLSRVSGPLVSVNVAGLDDNIFSDTLFGHVKGAFTGAAERRAGLVERATGGTLHLDEIGELHHESQVKLLRLLQEGEYLPLGADTVRTADIRVVASTNRDLSQMQEDGRFRKDLYYRLSVHHLQIPPLRQRRGDVPLLLHHCVREAAQALAKPEPTWSDEVLVALYRYDFPGNIRELRTMIQNAVSLNTTGTLTLRDFRERLGSQPTSAVAPRREPIAAGGWQPSSLDGGLPTMAEATSQLIREALKRCNNNQSEAARLLGISRQRLARNLIKPE
jgi:DNA-binding NtrC family response regulator